VSTAPQTLSGRTVGGRYQVLRDLGEESLGRTYVARDAENGGRLVQIKAVSPALEGDEETFARFGREISASFMVSHRNTVEVLDYGQEGEVRYLVSEYLAAHPLSREISEGGLPIPRVASIAAQVAAAMGAAHQEGIVHRALTADTVLLLENARSGDYVKVRDFGLSKFDRRTEEAEVTRGQDRVGSEGAMAPEYIQTGEFHPKGDLYALGCLLFEAISGRRPFEGQRAAVLQQHVADMAPRLSSVTEGCPQWLDDLVAALLAKDPAARPGVHEIVQRLEAGVGRALAPPALWPLHEDGTILAEAGAGGAAPRLAGLLVVGALGGVAVLVIAVAALATLALVLGLPR